MAYKITNKCISCDLCLNVCPTNAIKVIDGKRWIDPNLCTNCVGSIYSVPQCTAGCPTCDGCVKEYTNYWDSWFDTYKKCVAKLTNKEDNYWQKWFSCYSQKYAEQLAKRNPELA
ncbi:4Fe-4S binding protein [Calothrix sp. NIES-3974]|uniref:4Fe-4S binding protein n=1 Tax=Calothrix sp. NIES-3974 TaxID=2005462 RepID=UPI000B61CAB2|nr:4Fe-4S binding protein [Calothrix sp. NIES-3974]BAZ06531.1 4Fe-4S ferredoxin iron-sulfur binding domain-containing protein [Calothrix sp. NIES-3974]